MSRFEEDASTFVPVVEKKKSKKKKKKGEGHKIPVQQSKGEDRKAKS